MLRAEHFIHSHKHTKELVKYIAICFHLENKELELQASLSCPENSQTSPKDESLLLNDKTPGFFASGEDEFNLGLETRLDRLELLCLIKFYSSIKEIEKASDIGIRRGQKEYPPPSLQLDVI